jgi:transcription antitermination factor NusG
MRGIAGTFLFDQINQRNKANEIDPRYQTNRKDQIDETDQISEKCRHDTSAYKVKWTRGVSKLLGFGDGPVPISEKVIQTIKERVGKDNLVKLEEELKEGDVVQITSGPFKELSGIFQKKISDNGRVRILLNLVGVDITVQISQWQIKKAA